MRKHVFGVILALSTICPSCYYHVDFVQRSLYACGDEWQGSNGQTACVLVYQAQ